MKNIFMIVPDKILEKWLALKDKSDITKMIEDGGVSYFQIRKAFEKKEITMDVFTTIADFYDKKLKQIKSYL